MSLTQLSVKHVRNLKTCELQFNSRFNFIEGDNASGKTSLLEAIYLISQVKSFRTHRLNYIIQHQQTSLQVVAQYVDSDHFTHIIGLERDKRSTIIHLNKSPINLSSKLASLVPIQIITPESHRLLEDGPKFRRQFIDWGVFHVKHSFLQIWKDYHRILRQRNAALRQGSSKNQIESWNKPLIDLSEQFHTARIEYLRVLKPIVDYFSSELLNEEISLSYLPGWQKDLNYADALRASYDQDCQFRHTRLGPHRADLSLKWNKVSVQASLSRGQQKLLVCALRLAQIKYLQSCSKQPCIILVDDLPAELDQVHRSRLIKLLDETTAQIFVTTTDATLLKCDSKIEKTVFHVEHGEIKEVIY